MQSDREFFSLQFAQPSTSTTSSRRLQDFIISRCVEIPKEEEFSALPVEMLRMLLNIDHLSLGVGGTHGLGGGEQEGHGGGGPDDGD